MGGTNDGAIFSTNDSLFYDFAYSHPPNYDVYFLAQYNMHSPNIYASKQVIKYLTEYPHLDMKQAPDGKIYITCSALDSLDVINFPNVAGVGCGYQPNAIYLNGRKQRYMLPNKTFQIMSQFTSNIENKFKDSPIIISPNPTSDQFYIETSATDKLNVDLYDVNGRHVFSESANDKSNINVATLDNGIYTLTIKTVDSVTNKKLVIVH